MSLRRGTVGAIHQLKKEMEALLGLTLNFSFYPKYNSISRRI